MSASVGYDEDICATPVNTAGEDAPLALSVSVERDVMQHDKAHNVWASFKLCAQESQFGYGVRERVPADFVVVVDTSESMKCSNKLASVLATIEYMMDVLTENDRFALVHFNEAASVLFALDYMTTENKSLIRCILMNIKAMGDTNIGDGLFTALSIIQSRSEEKLPISRILLLTDGLSNRGLSHSQMIQKLQEEELNENLTIHCFGYGKDHSSSALQAIAFRSPGGLYYFIENNEHIAETFGDCLAGTFSTIAYSIHIYLEAYDGCRFIKIRTKYPFKTVKSMKKYFGSLGSMYEQESRTVLMRLSLRAMNQGSQNIFRVTVAYTSAYDNTRKCHRQMVVLERKPEPKTIPIDLELDKQINRVTSAEAIDKAISAASVKNFGTAEQIIHQAIQKISTSRSSTEPFCQDLIADLRDCIRCVSSQDRFKRSGIHEAYQFSTMHNQERSVGVHRGNRSANYGYSTTHQVQQVEKASQAINSYLSGYFQYEEFEDGEL